MTPRLFLALSLGALTSVAFASAPDPTLVALVERAKKGNRPTIGVWFAIAVRATPERCADLDLTSGRG